MKCNNVQCSVQINIIWYFVCNVQCLQYFSIFAHVVIPYLLNEHVWQAKYCKWLMWFLFQENKSNTTLSQCTAIKLGSNLFFTFITIKIPIKSLANKEVLMHNLGNYCKSRVQHMMTIMSCTGRGKINYRLNVSIKNPVHNDIMLNQNS